jgi:hypothetical protein
MAGEQLQCGFDRIDFIRSRNSAGSDFLLRFAVDW